MARRDERCMKGKFLPPIKQEGQMGGRHYYVLGQSHKRLSLSSTPFV